MALHPHRRWSSAKRTQEIVIIGCPFFHNGPDQKAFGFHAVGTHAMAARLTSLQPGVIVPCSCAATAGRGAQGAGRAAASGSAY
jgi:hypothetical protein